MYFVLETMPFCIGSGISVNIRDPIRPEEDGRDLGEFGFHVSGSDSKLSSTTRELVDLAGTETMTGLAIDQETMISIVEMPSIIVK